MRLQIESLVQELLDPTLRSVRLTLTEWNKKHREELLNQSSSNSTKQNGFINVDLCVGMYAMAEVQTKISGGQH